MSRADHLLELRKQRDAQLAALRNHLQGTAAALQQQPREWVGAHPYAATMGAAAAGFLAVKLAGVRQEKPRIRYLRRHGPYISAEASGRQSAKKRSGIMEWLETLMAVWTPLLEACATRPDGGSAAKVRVGDAGATSGTDFPGTFTAGPSASAPPVDAATTA